jgi:tRNA(Ile)-lysidine synthase
VQITVDHKYLQRFRDALDDFDVGPHDRMLLAVSGGPDSIALMLLASGVMAGRIHVATVDHKLRPEAKDEAMFVGTICADMGIPHIVLSPVKPISGNIQSAARNARYELLQMAADQHDCLVIATAHHGDDQLETILMRLARGSGIEGLAAIRRKNGRIIRPLLGFSKSELEEICVTSGIEPVRDPSNDNSGFDRIRFRQWLAQKEHPFHISRINRSAVALAEASDALGWMTETLATSRVSMKNDIIQCDVTGLPREVIRRLLLRCVLQLQPDLQVRGEAIDHLLARLGAGQTAMIGNLLCKGGRLWQFSVAPPRSSRR